MWIASNGHSRAIAGVATAGVVALTAGGVTALPDAAPSGPLVPASVSVPVELTALAADASLMDIVGALTGLNFIIPLLSSPDSPLFPIVATLEALGELFVIMPLTLAIGTPLLLLTEGFEGVQDLFNDLGAVFDSVQSVFDNIMHWYATHNWLTGALLDVGASEAVELSGWGEMFPGTSGFDDVLTVDGFDAAFTADGFDTVLTDFGLGDLIA